MSLPAESDGLRPSPHGGFELGDHVRWETGAGQVTALQPDAMLEVGDAAGATVQIPYWEIIGLRPRT